MCECDSQTQRRIAGGRNQPIITIDFKEITWFNASVVKARHCVKSSESHPHSERRLVRLTSSPAEGERRLSLAHSEQVLRYVTASEHIASAEE